MNRSLLLLVALGFVGMVSAYKQVDVDKLNETGNCKGCDLSGAALDRPYSERYALNAADLEGADLSGAQLYFMHLHKANLKGAKLVGVKFGPFLGIDYLQWALCDKSTRYDCADTGVGCILMDTENLIYSFQQYYSDGREVCKMKKR